MKHLHRTILIAALALAGVAQAPARADEPAATPAPETPIQFAAPAKAEPETHFQRGQASFYGRELHGRLTASGERFNRLAMTAAHRFLPFGTLVRVQNLLTGRSVVVRINDRGPFKGDRVIDLSEAAGGQIGLRGVAPVRITLE
jgi:rare lipoprotein A